jgi:uncharacterized membrane protein
VQVTLRARGPGRTSPADPAERRGPSGLDPWAAAARPASTAAASAFVPNGVGSAGFDASGQRGTADPSDDDSGGDMSQVQESIRVGVPVRTAYNQWTQFEEFPRFMDGVDRIEQIDDTHLRWTVSMMGRQEEFTAVITEQIPDTRIAWTTTDGPHHAGAVDFHRIDDDETQIMVVMDAPDESPSEKAAGAVGVVSRRVKADLERFKEMIEERGEETGAWRGSVSRN